MLTIYKASAGSGKTYTLTYEYIKLLMGEKIHGSDKYKLRKNPDGEHEAILAITFTNKATEEMKSRIIRELAILAELPVMGNEKSPYLKDLKNLFGCSDDELKECANKVLGQLLFDYLYFNVSTIDSFFQNVLRTFAFEADMTGDYDVELSDDIVIQAGVSEMFNAINYNNDDVHSKRMVNWLTGYMKQNMDEGKGFNVFNRNSGLYRSLVKFVNTLSDEQFKLYHSEKVEKYFSNPNLIIEFEKQLTAQISKEFNRIKNQINDLNKYINDRNALDWIEGKSIKPGIAKLSNAKTVSELSVSDAFKKNVIEIPEKVFNAKCRLSEEERGCVINKLNDIVESISTTEAKCLCLLRKEVYRLGLVGDVIRHAKQFREQNNMILLSDTNDILKRIISEDEAPFIYERLGVKLNHFLIDEFQDTSRLQWENISPLVRESLGRGNDNLIIGDVKQSIYRFRNADPTLLQYQVAEDFGNYTKERGMAIEENTNWRSSAEVIRFNNTVFTAISKNLGLDDIYSNVVQQVSKKHENHKGYVKVEMPEDGDASLEILATDIKRQLDAGYKQKDIAILVRKRKEGEKVVEYLMGLKSNPESGLSHLEIMTEDALTIESSPVVKLIINTLRLLSSDIRDDMQRNKKRKINQLQFRFLLNKSTGMNGTEALAKAISNPDSETDLLLDAVKENGCTNLMSIVECIIESIANKDASLIEDNLVYVTAFQDEVISYCSRGSGDVSSFLRYWDTKSAHGLTSSADVDAIRIMTFHKSKGLEFKCVHIPYANMLIGENPLLKNYRWFNSFDIKGVDSEVIPPVFLLKNEKDAMKGTMLEAQCEANLRAERVDVMNNVYVAFTRAIDELCINSPRSSRESSEGLRKILDAAFDRANQAFCDEEQLKHNVDGQLFVPLKERFNEDKLEIGEPTTPREEEAKNVLPVDKVTELAPSPYFTKYREDIWATARLEDAEMMNEAQERGIFLHKVMENVRHRDDLILALKRQAYRNAIPQEEVDEMYKNLSAALEDERAEQWFEGYTRVVTERPIGVGALTETTRPDRVVWTAKGTVDVVDYKFGEEDDNNYKRQVKGYMQKLTDMGHENVRGFVWYMFKGKIVEVK